MGRKPSTVGGIRLAQLRADIRIIAAGTKNAAARLRKIAKAIIADEIAAAHATASNVLGNGLRATVRNAMVEFQNGACFTCGVKMNSTVKGGAVIRETIPELFRLMPSILAADSDIAGVDAMNAITIPGNVVAVCTKCNDDRNAAMSATGSPIHVDVNVMKGTDYLNPELVLIDWPKSPVKGEKKDSPAIVSKPELLKARESARITNLGW